MAYNYMAYNNMAPVMPMVPPTPKVSFSPENNPENVKMLSMNQANPKTLKKVFKLDSTPDVLTDPDGLCVVHGGDDSDATGWNPKLKPGAHYYLDVEEGTVG